MIKGIGIDMTRIERVKKACEKEHFLKRIFTEEEIRRYQKFPVRLAGNFAVKEAVAKCFGTGFRGFEPIEIEALRDELGRPYVVLHGKAKQLQERLGIETFFVTLTNEDEYACAAVVAEGRDMK